MIKKIAISAGVFAISAIAAGSLAFAQTATPTTAPSPTTSTTNTTTSPTPTTTLPGGAPTTGRGA